jgi:hypothetical protein
MLELMSPLLADRRVDSDADSDHDDADDGDRLDDRDDRDRIEELDSLLRWVRIDRFDRRALNRQLAQLETAPVRVVV